MIATATAVRSSTSTLMRWHLLASALLVRHLAARRARLRVPVQQPLPVPRHRVAVARPRAHGAHQHGRVRVHRQRLHRGHAVRDPAPHQPADPLRLRSGGSSSAPGSSSSCSPSAGSSPATARGSSGARRRSSSTRSSWSGSCSWSSTCRCRSSARGEQGLYVSLWYFLAAFAWTGLVYVMGNYLPQFWVPGTAARRSPGSSSTTSSGSS